MTTNPTFRFDAETHEYFVNDRRIFGVTEVLKQAGLINTDWFTEFGRDRGKAVHLACEYLAKDELDWQSVDPRIEPYVRGYEKFLKDTNFDLWKCEEPLFHLQEGFAGTFDNYGYFPALGVAVIDVKSGSKQRYHGPQLAAYQRLIMNKKWKVPDYRFALRLKDDGTYALDPYTDRNDWKVFKSALAVVQKQAQLEMELEPYFENLRKWKEAA